MEVRSGCDVNESLTRFACERQQELCVLSGRRFVTNFTLKQPATTGATVTLHGRFEILSMVGSILPPPGPSGITGPTIYLAAAQGGSGWWGRRGRFDCNGGVARECHL